MIAYDFARPAHINCLESRTVKTLAKLACRTSPDARIATLIDSRVTIGAGAKGRSSSAALSRIQQGSLAYVLGGGLYLGQTTPCVTGRFGARASTSPRGFPNSSRSAFRVSTSSFSRIVSAVRGTFGAACFSLRVSARARATKLGASLSPPARWRAASMQLRCFGTSA